MATSREDWKRPPLIEVALAVQFEPIQKLTGAHLGRFWLTLGDKEYPNSQEAQPINIVEQDFREELEYAPPGIEVVPASRENRFRFSSADETRMVQIQNGWIVANWIKQSGQDYPGFDEVFSEFQRVYSLFVGFVGHAALGPLKPNMWEVTYIDHIRRGTVWNAHAEVANVLPGLVGPCNTSGGRLEAINSRWGFFLGDQKGRMSMQLFSARYGQNDVSSEMFVLTTTARGPITTSDPTQVEQGLQFGRTVVVGAFKEVSSPSAKAYWRGS